MVGGEPQMSQDSKAQHRLHVHTDFTQKTNWERKIMKEFRQSTRSIKPQAWGPSESDAHWGLPLVPHPWSQCHLRFLPLEKGNVRIYWCHLQNGIHFLPLFWILFIKSNYHKNLFTFGRDVSEPIYSDTTLIISWHFCNPERYDSFLSKVRPHNSWVGWDRGNLRIYFQVFSGLECNFQRSTFAFPPMLFSHYLN